MGALDGDGLPLKKKKKMAMGFRSHLTLVNQSVLQHRVIIINKLKFIQITYTMTTMVIVVGLTDIFSLEFLGFIYF